ncbi:MAG: 8-oxo-dGTP diphosphatase [Sphaerochaetaceae bacterium]|jgi:8-oxo-dGTP diphosphatase
MLQTIADQYLWVIAAILMVNLYQRRIADSEKKRFSTLYIASLALLFNVFLIVIITKNLPQWTALIGLAIVVTFGVIFRKRVWPFRLHCVSCGAKLDTNHVIGHDDNLCPDCWAKAHPQEAAKQAEEEAQRQAATQIVEQSSYSEADHVEDIDWDLWEPAETCVITYLFAGEGTDRQVLLIDKKTGLGDGLVNAPGGHLEIAETAEEAAVREFREETGLEISDLSHRGVLNFQFKDGLSMRGHVFFAYSYRGEMVETDEARPFWCPVSDLPYDKMWEDDRLWLPSAIEGKRFEGFYIFDDRTMKSERLDILPKESDEDPEDGE